MIITAIVLSVIYLVGVALLIADYRRHPPLPPVHPGYGSARCMRYTYWSVVAFWPVWLLIVLWGICWYYGWNLYYTISKKEPK